MVNRGEAVYQAARFREQLEEMPDPCARFSCTNEQARFKAPPPLFVIAFSGARIAIAFTSAFPQAKFLPLVVVGGALQALLGARFPVRAQPSSFSYVRVLNAALWSRSCEGRVIASWSGKSADPNSKAAGLASAQRPALV